MKQTYMQKWYIKNKEKHKANLKKYHKAYTKTDKYKAYQKAYSQTLKYKTKRKAYMKTYCQTPKYKAYRKIYNKAHYLRKKKEYQNL